MGNKSSRANVGRQDAMFQDDDLDTHSAMHHSYHGHATCHICENPIFGDKNEQRCMRCGSVACSSCLKAEIDATGKSYKIICKQCEQQTARSQQERYYYSEDNLMQIAQNHRNNGRELLVYGYLRVLWVSHCLLYGVDYNSRFPSKDVIQCLVSWLYVKESFDANSVDKSIIKLSNCNQCIQRIADYDLMNNCHVFGTSLLQSPALKVWKFQIQAKQYQEVRFEIGVVEEPKSAQLAMSSSSDIKQHGHGFTANTWPNDVVVLVLDLSPNRYGVGALLFRVYRDEQRVEYKSKHQVSLAVQWKLAVTLHSKATLAFLEEWW